MFNQAKLLTNRRGALTANVLVVAGGGAGGVLGGGGGGGGVVYTPNLSLTGSYNVIVGFGGQTIFNSNVTGGNGGDSIFGNITALGGGGGGSQNHGNGAAGGSGGGGGGATGGDISGGAGTVGQGNDGGTGSTTLACGGGGGANALGAATVGVNGGNGGNGIANSISGGSVTYGGGGGGGGRGDVAGAGGTGGTGGGGNGDAGGTTGTSTPGTDGLGGGGGGSGYDGTGPRFGFGNEQNGGKGVVIISYAGATKASGGTITSVGGNTIHTFTSDGTFEFETDLDPYTINTSFSEVAPNWILNGLATMTVQNFNADAGQGKSIYTTANTAINGAAFFPNQCSGNQFVQATISANDSGSGDPSYQGGHLGLCIDAFVGGGQESNGYALDIRHIDGITIYNMVAGSYTVVVGPTAYAPADWTNFTMKFEKVGNTLNGYINGALAITGSDSNHQSGYIEVGGDYDTAAYYKDISGGNPSAVQTFGVL